MKIKPSKKLNKVILEVNPRTQPRVAAALFRAARKLPAIRLKKILAATDFSPASLEGVRYADSLAGKVGAATAVVYVVEPPVYFSGTSDVMMVRDDAAVVEQAQKHLAKIAERESKPGVRMPSFVRQGKPFHEIVALARDQKMDLIVIATRGRTGLKRIVLGSTAERVVRHAPCPVLTVPFRSADEQDGGPSALRLKRIVVPIDFSATSAHALPYAAALAEQFAAEVVLLHVIEPVVIPAELRSMSVGIEGVVESPEEVMREELTRLGQEMFDETVSVRAIVRTGVPFQEITKAARSLGADMIVLTTYGHTGLKHMLLGSTAERVVRHADCQVLVVRATVHTSRQSRRK